MKITDEQIRWFQNGYQILQTPGHFPDSSKAVEYYREIYADEIENKKSPYYQSLSPNCSKCIRHCVFTVKNDLVKLGILDIKGDFK